MKKRGKKQVVPSRKRHIKKGDMVIALTGEDAGRGKPGKVLQVLPKQQRAIVEGFNIVKKHMRKTQEKPEGGIASMEGPIHISNLMKVDASEKPAGKDQ